MAAAKKTAGAVALAGTPQGWAAYIVANPRGIPEGRHILRVGDQRWYEGDAFAPPKGCDVQRLVRDGFIVKEKADG